MELCLCCHGNSGTSRDVPRYIEKGQMCASSYMVDAGSYIRVLGTDGIKKSFNS